jgi:ribosomal protein L35
MLISLLNSLTSAFFCRFKSQTHSGASKRFTKLSDGNFLRRKAGRNHNFAKKDSASRANVRTPVVTSRAQSNFIRNLSV